MPACFSWNAVHHCVLYGIPETLGNLTPGTEPDNTQNLTVMPKNLITLTEQFGGHFTGAGRSDFILSDPKRIQTLMSCAASMGARATTIDEKTIGHKHLARITVVFAS